MIANLFLFPFRLAWDLILLAAIIALFCVWWPFLFGSVIGVILVLVFAPGLFIWPAWLSLFMLPLWED